LPVDDFLDLSGDISLSDLRKLDREAAKAEKRLNKLKKKGGIFAGTTAGTTTADKAPITITPTAKLSKQDRKIEKRLERLSKKVNKDVVKNFGKDKEGAVRKLFGDDVGKTLFNIGKNPVSFLKNSIIGIAGVGFALEIAKVVIQEIQRIDKFFKVFIDRIDDRNDQLRNKELQARVRAGQQQIIITSAAGNVDARESYNTFEQFNNNRAQLEADFAIRDTSGIV